MRMCCTACVCLGMLNHVGEVVGGMGEELTEIQSDDVFVGDVFGGAVAADGNFLVVGVTGDDDNGSASGSAYVFDISDPARPTQVSKLMSSDGETGDVFGESIAISGGVVVIGAMRDDENGWDSGSAYVFDISDPAHPVQLCKLIANDGTSNDQFGIWVALSGSTVVVGALADSDHGHLAGGAYVFDISDPANPVQVCKLMASDGEAYDFFGGTVAVSGRTVLVGAHGDDDKGSSSGSVYLYDISDPVNPEEIGKLYASDGITGDSFGGSVAVSGDTVVVGAGGDDVHGENSGSAYVFDISDPARPVELSKLYASDGSVWDIFGVSVAIDGARVVVGAWWDDGGSEIDAGSAYAFDISEPLHPVEIGKLYASDGGDYDYLGESVAVSGHTAMAGAFGDDDNGDGSGSVFIFDILGCDGDANRDGMIDVNDISYVLFRLGGIGGGDANGDGAVDVNDISHVLARLGEGC